MSADERAEKAIAEDLHARVQTLLDEHDPASSDPREFLAARFDAGLAWVHFPRGSGGLDLPRAFRRRSRRVVRGGRATRAVAGRNGIGMGMAAPTIAAFGSASSSESCCGRCSPVSTSIASCSVSPVRDPTSPGLATRAVRDGDDWIVNGQKVWTSSAQNAQRAILVARTDPSVPKHQGLTYFVCDMTDPGVDVRPLRQITGEAEFNEVFLTDVRVPDANRLGPEGGGWKVATTTLNNERVAIGSMAGGARENGMIGKVAESWRAEPQLRNPAMHDELMRLWVAAEVARLTGLRLRQRLIAGQPGPEGAGLKVTFARLAQAISGFEIELHPESGLQYDDWTMRQPEIGRLHRPRARISLPAGEGQLDRGWHVGDPAQYHRRAHPRAAAGTPGRQRDRIEGSRPMSDLLYSDTEEALRDSVRRLFADRCPPESVTSAYDPAPQDFSGVWHALAADLGMAGLLVPETPRRRRRERPRGVRRDGGDRSGCRAGAILVQRGAGHRRTAGGAGRHRNREAVSAGSLTAALAVPLSTAPDDPLAGVSVSSDGLTGRVTSVAGASEADVLVVPVAGADGLELHTVARDAAGVEVSPVLALDMTRPLANVGFRRRLRHAWVPARPRCDAALQTGAALLASEQLGVAQWCFETTLAYVKQRKQFGRAIGSYQAIKHRLADLWIESIPLGARPDTPPTRAPGATTTRRSPRPSRRPIAADRRACRRRMRSVARRHRDDVGVSSASVPQACQERSAGLRHRLPAPCQIGRAGRPAARQEQQWINAFSVTTWRFRRSVWAAWA